MLKLSVVTPEGQTLAQEVDEVTVPGLLGEFGVLDGHVPLLAEPVCFAIAEAVSVDDWR